MFTSRSGHRRRPFAVLQALLTGWRPSSAENRLRGAGAPGSRRRPLLIENLEERTLLSVQFSPAISLTAGTEPLRLTVGDFNGDKIPDLAVANSGQTAVSVFLGKGDGTFQAAKSIPVPVGAWSVAVGDFNGDGKLDLVAIGLDDNANGEVSLLLGNGDGTFQPAKNTTVGSFATSVVAADFNGDGKLDLATANEGDNTVSVLLGNGDGTFQTAKVFNTGSDEEVAAGDLNHDGKLDLMTANNADGTVSVLLGNGDGTFQNAQTFSVGPNPDFVAIGDFNGDGKADLITVNNNLFGSTGSVSFLQGNGDGTFQNAQTQNDNIGGHPQPAGVADFNGDGKLDLAIPNVDNNTIGILLGNGDGTFQNAQNFGTGQQPHAAIAADLNGDGKPDVATANEFDSTASVLLNQTASLAVTPPSDQNANEAAGQSFSLGSFSDPDSGPWSATVAWGDGTTNTTFNPSAAGMLTSQSHTYAEEGTFTVTVTVNDTGAHTSRSTMFKVTVADLAVLGTAGTVSAIVKQSFTGTVATFTDPGNNEPIANYAASIDWGDSSTTTGTIGFSNGTFTVTGTHTYANTGNPTIKVSLTHEGVMTPVQFQASVTTAPPPKVTPPQDQTANEAASTSFSLGSFSDSGGNGPWSGSIDWGDGSTTPLTITGTGSLGSQMHTYAEQGLFTVTVTVTDTGDGQQGPGSFKVNVADLAVIKGPAMMLSVNEGVALTNQAVGTFTDPGGAEPIADYSATIDWGDNTTTTGSIGISNGTFTVTGSHTYTEEGSYALTIAVQHEATTPTTLTASATVAEQAVVGNAGSVNATTGQPFTGTVATFTDPGGNEPTANYSAGIDWGDSSTTTGTIGFSNGTFTVTGTHTYANTGNPTIKVSLTHEGVMTPVQFQASVSNVPTVNVTPPQDQSTNEGASTSFSLGSFSDGGSGPWTGSVDWGDGSTTSLTITAKGSLGSQAHTYAEEGGPYTVKVSVTDTGTKQQGFGSFKVSVSEVAVVGSPGSVIATVKLPFNGTVATFTDSGGAEATANYAASIDWGDSSTTTGTIGFSNGTFTVTGTHTYANTGNPTIKVSLTHEGVMTPVQFQASVSNVSQPPQHGQVASFSFWTSARGLTLLQSFNGGPTSTALGNWLASSFPNLYGANAGSHNLAGKTNTQVAIFYLSYFTPLTFFSLDMEVLTTAFNVYATTLSLGGTAAQSDGFQVDANGLGAAAVNVGVDGAGFGVPNGTTLSVWQLLQAANSAAVGGSLWNNQLLQHVELLLVFLALDEQIGTLR